MVKELLGHGVDTSTADFKGRTALHVAAHVYAPDFEAELDGESGESIGCMDG